MVFEQSKQYLFINSEGEDHMKDSVLSRDRLYLPRASCGPGP